jgi:ATP-binding cassette subfamily B protein
MNYALNTKGKTDKASTPLAAVRGFLPYLRGEWGLIAIAAVAIAVNAAINLAGPLIVGRAIDAFVVSKEFGGVLRTSGLLLFLYCVSFVAAYIQTRVMGGVAQRLLFTLRDTIFLKLQELPIAFFNQNATGDLISRINSDTDKLNQFFSQSLMQFIGNTCMIAGAAGFLLVIHTRLGLAALAPALLLLIVTRVLSPWIRAKNALSLKAAGGMSAEIQESLENFKVIVAYDRRDYFREKFREANEANYRTAVTAGIANNVYVPMYGLCSAFAQLAVLAYGIALIADGQFTVGLLISYLTYVSRFYDPLRQSASLWASFQGALAAWDRISAIIVMQNDMPVLPAPAGEVPEEAPVLELEDVHFSYPNGKEVLHGIGMRLERGKTYALVGPTGGGKTTTASLMARLYDPTSGRILLNGRDIRAYGHGDRTAAIGFILQEPFLFTGTVRDNVVYGNPELAGLSAEQLANTLRDKNLSSLLARFDKGLDTAVTSGDTMSLGQRQIIAFMRAVLREPQLLILDEATANIDTVTEALLEDILRALPETTTKVIIAHRLNTIENADEIFFVNAGSVTPAGSLEHAVEMLLHHKRDS